MTIQHGSRKVLLLVAALALLTACVRSTLQPAPTADVSIDSLVTTEWLSRHLGDPDLVVLDCSVRVEMDESGYRILSGRDDYDAGHIPSAGFADLMEDLSDADSPHRFALPTPEQFSATMGALGVGDDSLVVLYDGSTAAWAARVWWMLRWVGFDNAALLDGGLRAWSAEGRPLSTEPAERPTRQLTPTPRPELIADRDEVLAAIDDAEVTIIDALTPQVYRGEVSMYGRPGHIPTAVNISAMSLIDESGRYRPVEELAAMLDGDRDARYITYCGGGIAASSNAFTMTRLGFTDVAVYTASLQEWAADPANPLVDETP
jgi:thiosulfate/3-mercaptopyruvate sulfurtransferase